MLVQKKKLPIVTPKDKNQQVSALKKHHLYDLFHINKTHRKYLITNRFRFTFAAYLSAAIEIQRIVRGWLVRKRLEDKIIDYDNHIEGLEIEYRKRIVAKYQKILNFMKTKNCPPREFFFQNGGITLMQAKWRVRSAFYSYQKWITYRVGLHSSFQLIFFQIFDKKIPFFLKP